MSRLELDYAAIFDASPNPYLVLDRSLNIVGANHAYLVATGRELDDIVGRWAWDAFPTDPETLRQAIESFERVKRTKQPDTLPLFRFDIPRAEAEGGGFETRYWSITASPVLDATGEVQLLLQHPIDVTELERLRDAVQAADSDERAALAPVHSVIIERASSVQETNLQVKAEANRLRELFAQAPSFMAIVSGPEHRFELVNEAYSKLIGYRDVVGMPVRKGLPDLEGQVFYGLLDQVWESGEPFIGRGMKVSFGASADTRTETRIVDFVYQPITDTAGDVSGIFVEGNDVTEAARRTEELRQQGERLRLVIEGAKDHAILTTDPEGCITSWSPGAETSFGWTAEEALGRPAAIIFTPEDRAQGADAAEFSNARNLGYANDERWHLRKDGRRVFMNGSMRPLARNAAGEEQGFLKIARDETERRRTNEALRTLNETLEAQVQERTHALLESQETLRQSQKLEAVGQLTGGVAHDFNNLLTIIRSSVDFLKREDLAPSRRTRYVEAISDTVERASKLTNQLLAFARRQPLKPEVFEVSRRVESVVQLIRPLTGARINIFVEPCDKPCFIEADVSQFETALVNLAVNARDAMNGEGRLTFKVGKVSEVPSVRGHARATGDFLAVSVTDTGSGIDPAQIASIFEPFYTTKEVGRGTGLGLSQVFGFTKQSGGEVDVQSTLGQGAVFTLYLPSVPGNQADLDQTAEPAIEEQTVAPSICVLIVEDNEAVGRFANEMLQDLGYHTRLVGSAGEALAVLADGVHGFDVVFSDVIMPGMNGVDLANDLHRRYPDLPVILTSGYSHVLALDGRHGFELLRKPYSIDELSKTLRRVTLKVLGG
ncbi:MAG: PAS domain-containing hybrid sensor histidine kinase/response regulator [Caulobacteraceae bacterium]